MTWRTSVDDLELRHGVNIDTARFLLVQLTDAAGATIHHDFAERPFLQAPSTRTMPDDDVREIEDVAPAMPVRKSQERIHAEHQVQRAVGIFAAHAR